MLDSNGYVSEGSGENIFLVKKGVLITPDLSSSILEGITRDTVMTLAQIKRNHGDDITMVCSHDPTMLERMEEKSATRRN